MPPSEPVGFMEPSTGLRYGGWIVVATMVAIGLAGANTYDSPGIATTWITWALLVHVIALQYRMKLQIGASSGL